MRLITISCFDTIKDPAVLGCPPIRSEIKKTDRRLRKPDSPSFIISAALLLNQADNTWIESSTPLATKDPNIYSSK
ncbi:hypothetical protein L596_005842 [Steinernema carpocapsae]|uniref:Uncharacterized protein n=1 Tax=Steinernema carpocapsae TaxID=34508 RepID=A0A4U8V1K4_STECR|nr:hypothetical protein L596_005842 [Steinernema carpocapsae]